MEGLVMEVKKKYVSVMTSNGEFLKLQKHGLVNIGDIYQGPPHHSIPINFIIAAAVLILIFTNLLGYNAYANQLVGYMDIAGKKNIRLYISRNGEVKKVEGLAGYTVSKKQPINEAVEEIITQAIAEGIYTKAEIVTVNVKRIKPSKINFDNVAKKAQEYVLKNTNSLESKKDTTKEKPIKKQENKQNTEKKLDKQGYINTNKKEFTSKKINAISGSSKIQKLSIKNIKKEKNSDKADKNNSTKTTNKNKSKK